MFFDQLRPVTFRIRFYHQLQRAIHNFQQEIKTAWHVYFVTRIGTFSDNVSFFSVIFGFF